MSIDGYSDYVFDNEEELLENFVIEGGAVIDCLVVEALIRHYSGYAPKPDTLAKLVDRLIDSDRGGRLGVEFNEFTRREWEKRCDEGSVLADIDDGAE